MKKHFYIPVVVVGVWDVVVVVVEDVVVVTGGTVSH